MSLITIAIYSITQTFRNTDTRVLRRADVEDFVILARAILIQYGSVTFEHTAGHLYRS